MNNPTIGTIPLAAFANQPTMAEVGDYIALQSPERIADFLDEFFNRLHYRAPGGDMDAKLKPIALAVSEAAKAGGYEDFDLVSQIAKLMERADA